MTKRSGALALAILATVSIALNYATRSLIPIASHVVCAEEGQLECAAADLVSESTSAFFVGDLLAQCAAGPLVRLVAGPWLLAASTAGWALSTLLLPWALTAEAAAAVGAHAWLQGIRGALCGLGYPSAHAVVAATPADLRATVLGLINAAAGLGSMLANVAVPGLLRRYASWEVSFRVLGVGSLVAAVALVGLSLRSGVGLWVTPTRHVVVKGNAGRPQDSRSSLGHDLWRWLQDPLIRGIIVWMVVVSIGGQAVGGAFLPTFFIEQHGLSVEALGVYTGVPPLAQVAVSLSAGVLCDVLVRTRNVTALRVHLRFQQLAVLVPLLSLLVLSRLDHSPRAACVLVTLWLGCTSFQSAGAMAVLHAVGGPRAGELFVLGNAGAKLGALLAASRMRWLLHTCGWPPLLLGLAAAYALAGILLLPHMHQVERAAAVVVGGATSKASHEKKTK